MAAAAISAAMRADGERSVHPFFTRINGTELRVQSEVTSLANSQSTGSGHIDVSERATEKPAGANSKRQNAKNEVQTSSTKTQKTLSDVVVPKVKNTGEYAVIDSTLLSHEQVEPRAKRRCTDEPDTGQTQAEAPLPEDTVYEEQKFNVTTQKNIDTSQVASVDPIDATVMQPSLESATELITPPKKMLRLKANGRFSSPVSSHMNNEMERRQSGPGRKRRKGGESISNLLVKVTYGNSNLDRDLMSNAINRILNGEERFTNTTINGQTKRTPQKPKATHPFFLGKAKAEPQAPVKPSPRKVSAVTPGKLRRQTFTHDKQDLEQSIDAWGSSLLRDRLMVRHPGAKEPPFPHKGQVHARNLDNVLVENFTSEDFELSYGRRKYKEARLPFPERESVVLQRLSAVTSDSDPLLRPDGFHDPPPSLHIPHRRLLCGADILQYVSSQLHTSACRQVDGAEETVLAHTASEPALQRLLEDIPSALTALDDFEGETLAWTQKYAPKTASEVLQPVKVMLILKDWLKSLKIQTVSSAISKDPKVALKLSTKTRKKRKKKDDELDDFLVDSDEDAYDMNEILDGEDGNLTEVGKSLKSIVQSSHSGARLSNAVLISGPPGCGKTAAAYAVAKEMDFKVFEINSSERRNGKDVIEKVGDMAENHLVKHHGTDQADLSSSEDPSKFDEAFRLDLESGRQGEMNAFFKPQATSNPKRPKQRKPQAPQILKTVQEAIKKPPKEQQQSLILLEEVDVLFRDDKDFWTIVLRLIADSKRPFIMTCNDEDIVPLQAIKLHAILRLIQPPEDLTVDYILLVAAAEGHLLDRRAILALYRSKDFDFRATLTQLDFWCQIGIGDPRGGLGWIYQRWPPGSDLDKQGRKLRVVSDGTYTETVGLVPDIDELSADHTLHWAWTELDIDPSVSLGWHELDQRVAKSHESSTMDPIHRLAVLKDFAVLADSLSAADVCCAFDFPGKPSLDMSTPVITDKARGQYVEGLRLLQTDECIDHAHLNEELFVNISMLAFQANGYSDDMYSLTADRFLPYVTAGKHTSIDKPDIGRRSFACFDAIATPEDSAVLTGTGMIQSAFDGPLEPIVLDLAPYTRSIVSYDRALEEQRDRIEQFTSDGRRAKRARTTRAARSALEGGQRATTRKERWFSKGLDYDAVLATGGDGWRGSAIELSGEGSKDGTEAPSPSATSAAGIE